MKVICDRGVLLDAINMISGVVAARTPRIQLTCVKLIAVAPGPKTAGSLALLATDAELSLRLALEQVDVQEAGEALIPADKLRQIVSAEEHEPTLTIEVQQEVCHIRGADAHFKIFGHPPADFPPIPDFATVLTGAKDQPKARSAMVQSAGQLGGLVSRTVFAAARENSRYAINGVLLKRDGKKLEMVATDGRRMALCRATLSGAGEKDGKPVTCIVPAKGLTMLQRLIRDPEEQVTVAITENQVFFCFAGVGAERKGDAPTPPDSPRAVLSSNLVEGAFPPYEEAIPREQDVRAMIDRDVLSSAVRRAKLLTNEESRGVKMSFKGGNKQLQLTSRAPETGESDIRIDLQDYNGSDIDIGFNPDFIADALKVMPDTQVLVELKAPATPGAPPRPAVIRSGAKSPAPNATAEFLYVVMPVNLQ